MDGDAHTATPEAKGGFWTGMLLTLVPFVLFGLVDWVLTAVETGSCDRATWLSLAMLASLWALAGTVFSLACKAISWLMLGRSGNRRALQWVQEWWVRACAEPGSAMDGRRIAGAAGIIAGIITFCALSVVFIASLIANRHGPVLIAVTAVVGQLAIGALAVLVGVVTFRLKRWAFELVGPGSVLARAFSFRNTVFLLAELSAGILIVVLVLCWETAVAVDGIAWLLLVLAAGVASPLLHFHLGHRVRAGIWILAIPLAALVTLAATAQSESTRYVLAAHSYTGKYFYKLVQKSTDFDGDGASVFPVWEDCAPFDSKYHPMATEVPGNGVDENCDGLDEIPAFDAGGDTPRKQVVTKGPKPDFLLITTDATRVDHISYLGYERKTTPGIDKLAKGSVVFTWAFSQDSGTGPSSWALMAGKTPFQVNLTDANRFPPRYAEGETTLAQVLKQGGYATAAVNCARMYGQKRWNIRDGFDHYKMVCGKKERYVAPIVLKGALARLRKVAGQEKPFFLWVHFLDPHYPYENHAAYQFGDRPIDNYDEEIRYTDEHIGKLLEAARKLKRDRPLYIVIHADHGENFAEHGKAPHARTLYKEVTHVPIIFNGPDIKPRLVDAPVALGDLYPTFIDLAGLEIPEGCTMVSQARVLFGEEGDYDRLVFQENSWSRPRRHVKGVAGKRFHMLMDLTTRTTELYDMVEDAAEKNNLVGKGLAEEKDLKKALQWFIQTTTMPKELQ